MTSKNKYIPNTSTARSFYVRLLQRLFLVQRRFFCHVSTSLLNSTFGTFFHLYLCRFRRFFTERFNLGFPLPKTKEGTRTVISRSSNSLRNLIWTCKNNEVATHWSWISCWSNEASSCTWSTVFDARDVQLGQFLVLSHAQATLCSTHAHRMWKLTLHKNCKRDGPSILSSVSSHPHPQNNDRICSSFCGIAHLVPYGSPSQRTEWLRHEIFKAHMHTFTSVDFLHAGK